MTHPASRAATILFALAVLQAGGNAAAQGEPRGAAVSSPALPGDPRGVDAIARPSPSPSPGGGGGGYEDSPFIRVLPGGERADDWLTPSPSPPPSRRDERSPPPGR